LAIVNTSPTVVFPTGIAGTKVMYVTDDWVSGAPMMGLSKGFVQKTLKQNLRHADIVASVSPYLSEKLRTSHGRSMAPRVLPNGCDLPEPRERLARSQNAGVIGTLNERLDMSLLEAVRDSGTAMVMIGPRADRDPEFSRRLDTFLGSENVTWLGQLPAAELPAHLARLGVGLTPYRDDDFNRASFPLKTLEYLAAGLPVVASDLPAVRWLNTESVAIAAGPAEFVEKVQEALGRAFDPLPEESRRAFAGRHTWQARAAGLLAMIEVARQ
jgi:teichuronic acid biosynthesis glycosyltransferase TuaH